MHVSRTCTYTRNHCNIQNINIWRIFVVIDEIGYFTFSNNSDVPPNEARPNSIFVFDDVAFDKQDTVREYFSMGKYSHVDCFYLC